jgi:hypothetical protein
LLVVLIGADTTAFHWRSSLAHHSTARGDTTYGLPNPASEYLFTLLAYALALSNHALSLLPPLPTAATNQVTSTEQEKATTAQYARCVELLCQASGLLEWMGTHVVLEVDKARMASGRTKWPIEASRDVLAGLSM